MKKKEGASGSPKTPTPFKVLSVLFVAFIAVSGGLNLRASRDRLAAATAEGAGFDTQTFVALEGAYNEALFAKYGYIELHGGFQRAMLKNEVGNFDVVRDEAGLLHVAVDGGSPVIKGPIEYTAESMAYLDEFNRYCQEQGIAFVCVKSIDKVVEDYTQLPAGVESYANQNGDALCAAARANGVDVLDLRALVAEDGLDPAQLFYTTDHHWTVETSLWAHGRLLGHLSGAYGVGAPNLDLVTDPDNYHQVLYEDYFLGSVGRRTGSLYGGVDDFTLLYPKFDTDLTYLEGDTVRTGRFEETLLFYDWIDQTDPYWRNCYAAYLDGDRAERTILNPEGQGKVLVVQNSMGLPFTAFLALSYQQVTILDFRHFTDMSLMEYLEQNPGFDAVVCLDQFDMPRFVP